MPTLRTSTLLSRTALATLALAAIIRPAQAQTAYALSNNTLIRFSVFAPNDVTIIGTLAGATDRLDGLDFRVSDGLLYGYNVSNKQLVTVNLNTAITTLVATASTVSATGLLEIDFNPVADRLRLVDSDAQNLRINPADGTAIEDTALAYAAGDTNFGVAPLAVRAAYTNNDNDAGTGTTLYYLDVKADTLVTTSDPNGGQLTTVGSLGITTLDGSFDALSGFDIYTNAAHVNTAYAILSPNAYSGLYTIDLGTGAATLVGNFSVEDPALRYISQLAIQPLAAPAASAPEPGSFALLLPALPLAGMVLRRRKKH